MPNSFFIRVASDRLGREAPLLLKLKAGPELYISAENLPRFTPQRIREVESELSAFSGHTIHAPFMDVWPGAADESVRRLGLEQMQRVMSLAGAWKSLLVVMHFNYDPIYYRQHFERWLDRAAGFYQTLLPESDGPLIALENIAEPTPYVALQLMNRAERSRLVHCFDFGHHHVFGRIPAEEWLFYLAPQRHIHFHLHDNFGANDDHLPLGEGNIDWQAARAAIRGVGCPFSITLEPHSAPALRAAAANFKRIFT